MIDLFRQTLMDTWSVVPRVLTILFLSLYGSQVLIELGIFEKLVFIGRPLASMARLPSAAGLTFVTSVGSVVAGNAMLARLHQEGKSDSKQTILTALLNSTPVYIRESFTYQIPVMVPLLGMKLRYSFARYAAIFGFSLGAKILAVSTGLGMLTRAAFLLFFRA